MTQWFLYDDTSGNTWIQTKDDVLRCPICNDFVNFIGYKGYCCCIGFKLASGWVRITEPHSKHNKIFGRGWSSLRKIGSDELKKWCLENSLYK